MLKRCFVALLALSAAVSSRADIVINEIHYDPDLKLEHVEFIELYNTGPAAVDLSGWLLTDAIDYQFPAGTTIAPNAYVVVSQNPTHFNAKFQRTALGPWTGKLSNDGDQIVLRNPAGAKVDEVNYQLGFPWPTVGEPPGYSIELTNPAFDNDLGGNWRAAGAPPSGGEGVLIPRGSSWKYFKGLQEPSQVVGDWRKQNFVEDANWLTGSMPVGYDPVVPLNTRLNDMSGSYTTIYFRKVFDVPDPSAFNTLQIQAMYDDGFKVWINERLVIFPNMPESEASFEVISSGSARESDAYETFTLPVPIDYLRQGQNIIAVQAANILKSGSSDCYLDLTLIGRDGGGGVGPTPGARNNSFAANIAPAIRQVNHSPKQPAANQPVIVSAKVTDPDGVASVSLQYQLVDPGNYIELTDAAYNTSWTSIPMNDAGTSGDEFVGDGVYSVTMPTALQVHRRLVRYRVTAADSTGKSITAPFSDDTSPNFAYFCYNGVPAWSGAVQPGGSSVTTYPESVMRKLPVYHLISKRSSVETSTWIEQYRGDLYKWAGTLVYDGEVYDHIHYRARGGVWRYAMGKNMWKMDFNRGHDFHPRDNFGREYKIGWTKLNLGSCIQQGDFGYRGEQGMFESVGFRLFNLAGIEGPHTHFIQFRIVDDASENGANQYSGDFWGLYLAIEQEDSRFLAEHDLPDSNFYKMEGGTGELNNLGEFGPDNKDDLNNFIGGYQSGQNEAWWRANFDLKRYYNYRAIVEGIHHYDIDENAGKNYFFYTNSITGLWSTQPWDLDLTWADSMYGGGNEPFRSRVLTMPVFNREYKNRVRELRDLLFNTDQAYKLIDEQAAMIYTAGSPSFVGADRAMWDYNPIMVSQYVLSSKSGQGRFYQAGGGDFPGMVQLMKNYVNNRGLNVLDAQAVDNTPTAIPSRPTISNISPAGNPGNKLMFQASAYTGSSSFAAMKWRLGEITPAGRPAYDPNNPRVYEIEPVWESAELTTYAATIAVPSGAVKVGHTYRARVKFKDVPGRWSNWSQPVEFVAGEPDNATALIENLRVTEIMYNPPAGSDYEFIELYNSSADTALDLSGIQFTTGIEFSFPGNSQLAPQAYCLVTRTPAAATFRNYYGLAAGVKIYGPYSGSLNNDGEEITLKTTAAGKVIISFAYGDNASWPVAADGAGHSIVPRDLILLQNEGDHSFPGNWRASTFIKGSPAAADPTPLAGPVINEIMANTEFSEPNFPGYSANDWIEIANPATQTVDFEGYYLSDDAVNLKKWALPAGTLVSGAMIAFDETTGFHVPLTAGFGLDQAGEQVYFSYLPGNGQDRVVDAQKFKGQTLSASWARVPNATGYFRSAAPTRGAANVSANTSIVISEIMYHPATNSPATTDNTLDEYVELYNPNLVGLPFATTFGAYRINGGIDFDFPNPMSIESHSTIILVNFDPAITSTSNAFRIKYSVPDGVRILGPYSGKLGNDSDRVALERPEPPKAAGEPISWVIIDEVTYGNRPSWPVDVDGRGPSLHRVSLTGAGNDPANWTSGPADPGNVVVADADTDGDGMPDQWEVDHNLRPDFAGDAAEDADSDGITNFAEYQAGTDPRDAESGLRIATAEITAGNFTAGAYLVAGKTYLLQRCDDLTTRNWQTAREFESLATGLQNLTDPEAPTGVRFYRVIIKPPQ